MKVKNIALLFFFALSIFINTNAFASAKSAAKILCGDLKILSSYKPAFMPEGLKQASKGEIQRTKSHITIILNKKNYMKKICSKSSDPDQCMNSDFSLPNELTGARNILKNLSLAKYMGPETFGQLGWILEVYLNSFKHKGISCKVNR